MALSQLDQIELAKRYVRLSNAHTLEPLFPMFCDTATYHSTGVGDYSGLKAIAEMMTGFFSRFPNVCWNVKDYHCVENNAVEFEFVMTATEVETGIEITRKGIEEIQFTVTGDISHISVKAK